MSSFRTEHQDTYSMRKLSVAFLCHFPPSLFEANHVKFDAQKVAEELRRGAFTTVEGAFIEALLNTRKIDLHVVTFSKAIAENQTVSLGGDSKLYVLRAGPGTGMITGWLPRILTVKRLLKRIQPDIVHGMRLLEGYGAMAVFCSPRHLVTPEEFFDGIPFPPSLWVSMQVGLFIERLTFAKAANVSYLGLHVKKTIDSLTKANLFYLPNIAADIFYQSSKGKIQPRLLYVGRISEEKGLLDFLTAACLLKGRRLSFSVSIVGGPSGPGSCAYLKKCQEYAQISLQGLDVEFLGWQTSEQIAALHQISACLVMPTQAKYETFGVVIAESLAAGTPVVGYDFGPLPDLVITDENGILVPSKNIEALANALEKILAEQATSSQELTARTQKTGLQFRKDIVAEKLLSIYKKIAHPSEN